MGEPATHLDDELDDEQERPIAPQPGPQTMFAQCEADIAFYGGTAGSGKSVALLYEPGKWCVSPGVRGFRGVLFRRTSPELLGGGGLWDESQWMYRALGGRPRGAPALDWTFEAETQRIADRHRIEFRHLVHEHTVHEHQGRQYAFIGFDEVTHFCLHPDHEVLTERGWVPIAEVTTSDRVLARVGGGAEFRAVLDAPSFDFDGELVEVDQRNGVSLLATPNHRVLVQRQDARRTLGFVRADHLGETIQNVPRAACISRRDRREPVRFARPQGRGFGRNANTVDECEVDLYLELLGWYLAEGCVSRGRYVRIAQTKPAPALDALMDRLPWRSGCDGRGGWVVCSRQLAEHLAPLGDTYAKRVPRWVFQCSPRQIAIFLEAFAQGDGSTDERGAVSIGLANRGLRDDLQELYTLAGRVATAGEAVVRGFPVYRLSVSQPGRDTCMVKPESVARVPYAGKVHCLVVDCPPLPDFTRGGHARPSVPGGNFLVRRKGRCHFTGNTAKQFWYMVSRLRSRCGVRPYVRGTCNPDPDSFVFEMIAWWIDADGYPILERSGVIRWFVRIDDALVWFDSYEAARAAYPACCVTTSDRKVHTFADEAAARAEFPDAIHALRATRRLRGRPRLEFDFEPMSFTFIAARLADNQLLLENDPTYRTKLMALPRVQRERLLGDAERGGNWRIREKAGTFFAREKFQRVTAAPSPPVRAVRFWDKAYTKPTPKHPDPDWTRGARVWLCEGGELYIDDLVSKRDEPAVIFALMREVAESDGVEVTVGTWEEPGFAGKSDSATVQAVLDGFVVEFVRNQADISSEGFVGTRSSRSQRAYARAWVPKLEGDKVFVRNAEWTDELIGEAHFFPEGSHDDIVAAISGAMQLLAAEQGTSLVEAMKGVKIR